MLLCAKKRIQPQHGSSDNRGLSRSMTLTRSADKSDGYIVEAQDSGTYIEQDPLSDNHIFELLQIVVLSPRHSKLKLVVEERETSGSVMSFAGSRTCLACILLYGPMLECSNRDDSAGDEVEVMRGWR